jgi:hypothetical protein
MGIQQWCTQNAQFFGQTVKECVHTNHQDLLRQYWDAITKGFSNPDGVFTISDVGSFISAAFYLPGNLVLYALANSVAAHDFFEIQLSTFNGGWAAALSGVCIVIGFLVFADL